MVLRGEDRQRQRRSRPRGGLEVSRRAKENMRAKEDSEAKERNSPRRCRRRKMRRTIGSRWPSFKAQGMPPTEVRKAQHLNSDEQVKAAQVRVVKLEAALAALGAEDPAAMGLALIKAHTQAQVRPVQDRVAHTEAFLSRSRKKLERMVVESREDQGGREGFGGQDPGWGTSVGSVAVRSQGAAKSFHSGQRLPRGNPSIAVEDCTDGGVSKWSMRQESKRPKTSGCLDLVLLGDVRHRAGYSMSVGVQRVTETMEGMCL